MRDFKHETFFPFSNNINMATAPCSALWVESLSFDRPDRLGSLATTRGRGAQLLQSRVRHIFYFIYVFWLPSSPTVQRVVEKFVNGTTPSACLKLHAK